MASYLAQLMHGDSGGAGEYRFDGDEGLLARTPATVVRAFMDHLNGTAQLGHVDYELNAAMKNRDKGVVTALGHFVLNGDEVPFVLFISAA